MHFLIQLSDIFFFPEYNLMKQLFYPLLIWIMHCIDLQKNIISIEILTTSQILFILSSRVTR